MIQANELRIGNWVNYNDEPLKICKSDIGETFFDPIPLTPEILKKCGFDECADGNEYRIGLPLGNGTDLVIETLQDQSGPYEALISDTTADEVPKHFSYLKMQTNLHQLQNLYFALTGKELEITP